MEADLTQDQLRIYHIWEKAFRTIYEAQGQEQLPVCMSDITKNTVYVMKRSRQKKAKSSCFAKEYLRNDAIYTNLTLGDNKYQFLIFYYLMKKEYSKLI